MEWKKIETESAFRNVLIALDERLMFILNQLETEKQLKIKTMNSIISTIKSNLNIEIDLDNR